MPSLARTTGTCWAAICYTGFDAPCVQGLVANGVESGLIMDNIFIIINMQTDGDGVLYEGIWDGCFQESPAPSSRMTGKKKKVKKKHGVAPSG